MKPKPYFVTPQHTTPDEPHSGWYFCVEDGTGHDCFCGPFSSKEDAEESIDEVLDELS